MKVLDASSLRDTMKGRAKHYKELRTQFTQLHKAFQEIVHLDDFEGKGAEAIKGFYQGQLEVVEAWQRLIDRQIAFFEGVSSRLEDKDLGGHSRVETSFLEEELAYKERQADEMISEQRRALEQIFRDIDDLVSLTPYSRSQFDDLMMDVRKKRTKTIDAVGEVDQELKDEYLSSEGEEHYVQALFQSLMEATRQGSSISPIHFDAEAYQSSDAYQSMVEAKTQTNSYLSYKKEEKEAREIANRPWYEDLWEGTKTFAGELTGYYDYIRAKDGVDPVTGVKLTEGQRVAAGAMAAAGFIPIVGWAGRALKGGKGIYSATKAIHTADHALDAYKNVRTFTKLEQTEMGIYGLISANGLSEYITGKDMFGNKLTNEQRQASITQSMIGAIPFVPYAPSMIKEGVRISEIPVNKTYQLVQTGLSKSQLKYKGFLTNIYQSNSQLSPLGPSLAMFKSDNVNNNVKQVSNHSVKSTSRVNTTKKTAGKTEVKYDFSQYEKKLVGNTWVLSKNDRTDQDAAKASLAYNEAIKKGEIKLDNEPDSDIYLEQIQAAKDGYNLWTGEELSKLESNSIIFSSLIGSVYGFRGGKITSRSIKVSKGDLRKIKEKVKGNKANTKITKGTVNNSKPVSGAKSIITPEMKEKILLGQRKNPNKNEIIGGHSSNINNSHSNYATESIKINPDGTKDIKYITQFPDGKLSKIKNSTIFPEGWSDIKILDSITDIGNSPPISIRGRDGATFHRGIVDGVEIDVIKIGDTVVSGYPTGQINAPLPGGFSK
ncbi:T7SS effector LXG polymorphic toxin (plasmid) [Niallia taxi]|uniref:T7SS effector LXG polymorphic toxin n=1 Tax=Niallia taxi TaxID=2499688 RepID=UPI002934F914|nr:T7SS effector LXG polymorphic toxin [Niallia taxi]WOD65184.1 T7SS effector LXG polymorphic toxin [Niallia taxi]